MADEQPPKRYQVRDTPDGVGPCYGRGGKFPHMVLDMERDQAVAYCRRPETAAEYAEQLNVKGFIEI